MCIRDRVKLLIWVDLILIPIKDQFLLNVIMPLFIEFIFFQELRFVFTEKLPVLHATTGFLYMRELEIHLIG